jgi:hypothetical protein
MQKNKSSFRIGKCILPKKKRKKKQNNNVALFHFFRMSYPSNSLADSFSYERSFPALVKKNL